MERRGFFFFLEDLLLVARAKYTALWYMLALQRPQSTWQELLFARGHLFLQGRLPAVLVAGQKVDFSLCELKVHDRRADLWHAIAMGGRKFMGLPPGCTLIRKRARESFR